MVVSRRVSPCLIGVAAVLVACGQPVASVRESATASAGASITIGLTEAGCELAGPEEHRAGPISVVMENGTGGQFDLDLWRLDDGHGYDELVSHIAEDMRRTEAEEPPLGHPDFAALVAEATVEPGADGELRTELEAGTYGFACISFGAPEQLDDIWAAGPLNVT